MMFSVTTSVGGTTGNPGGQTQGRAGGLQGLSLSTGLAPLAGSGWIHRDTFPHFRKE